MAHGDHIYIDCGTYTHHGIDCGDGTAIHYIGENLRGVITRTSMAEFSSGRRIFVKQYENVEFSDIVILRAESRLNENNYNLFFNNCEHFATWCKTGKHESEQVNRAATVAVAASVAGIGAINVMQTVTTTYQVSDKISVGLSNGNLERVGSLIRETKTTKVVACVREATPNISPNSQLLRIGAFASVLNLGMTMMGFGIVNQRLNNIEQRLQSIEEFLSKINRKIDLGYYANFRAALDLANDAIHIKDSQARKGITINAITKLKDASYIYTDYVDKELEQGSKIAGKYLQTLALAYVAEARCYLEIETPELALTLLQTKATELRPSIQKYVELLLTSNPAVYLHPQFKDQIDLRRLTQILQWIDPALDENAVFELQRENLVNFLQDPNKWVDSLPSAILDRVEVPWGMFGPNPEHLKEEAYKRLPQVLEEIESIIETYRRFEAYQGEVQAINQLGISFQEWSKLAPSEAKPDEADLMYIIPDKALDIVFAS